MPFPLKHSVPTWLWPYRQKTSVYIGFSQGQCGLPGAVGQGFVSVDSSCCSWPLDLGGSGLSMPLHLHADGSQIPISSSDRSLQLQTCIQSPAWCFYFPAACSSSDVSHLHFLQLHPSLLLRTKTLCPPWPSSSHTPYLLGLPSNHLQHPATSPSPVVLSLGPGPYRFFPGVLGSPPNCLPAFTLHSIFRLFSP